MRGEHCVTAASVLSAVAVILLAFVNIGQIKTGPVTSTVYFAQVDVAAYGSAWYKTTNISADGLYDTNNANPMGNSTGMRQTYRWGLYNACGYQKDGSGSCNSTIFGYPFAGRDNIIADIPGNCKGTSRDISGNTPFNDAATNTNTTRAGSLCIFVGSIFALFALITGAIKVRIFFLLAAVFSSLSALGLLIGAACWTAIIAKDSVVNKVLAGGANPLGMIVTAGPSLYITWVAFALMTLAVLPYVVSCCTFRRNE